jgi:hypothetical protein
MPTGFSSKQSSTLGSPAYTQTLGKTLGRGAVHYLQEHPELLSSSTRVVAIYRWSGSIPTNSARSAAVRSLEPQQASWSYLPVIL